MQSCDCQSRKSQAHHGNGQPPGKAAPKTVRDIRAEPLQLLTRNDSKSVWTAQHDAAFTREIQQLVRKPPVLKFYQPDKLLVLQCDASEKNLAASLLQEGRPTADVSMVLSPAKCNYEQIEKELLAIVFDVERFHQHTYGRRVTVDSDHKPLETISENSLASAPRHLQKMLMRPPTIRPRCTLQEGNGDVPSGHTE